MLVILSLSVRVDWSCPFTVLSLCLAVVYGLCLFLCLFYQFRLLRLPCQKRQSQRLFLHLCVAQCLLRALYFLLWPVILANNDPASSSPSTRSTPPCTITIEGENEGLVMMVIGSLPSALFLSAFTINVFTFARIYHSLVSPSVLRYRLVLATMGAVNVTTYTSLVLLYLLTFLARRSTSASSTPSDVAETLYLYALSTSTLVIASTFGFYGIKLWLGVRASTIDSQPLPASTSFSSADGWGHTPAPSGHQLATPFLTPSSSLSSVATTGRSGGVCGGRKYHPMLKLAVVSWLCFLCFLVRVILLPLLAHEAHGQFSFPLLLLYLCLSEVLPLLLVLYLFDPVREGKGLMVSEGVKGSGEGEGDEGDDEWAVDGDDDLGLAWDDEPRSARPALTVGSMGDGSGLGEGGLGSSLGLSLVSGGLSLASAGSVGREGMATLSPRELDRRRAKTGTSYQEAFRADLKALVGDD